MLGELKIRRKTDPVNSWIDCYTKWGFRLTSDTKDLHKKGKVVQYEYKSANSNERDFIAIFDEDGKVIRECTSMQVMIYTDTEYKPEEFDTLQDAFEDFVEYISGYKLEISSLAGGLSNFFTLNSEISPTPTYGADGNWTHVTCSFNFKQLTAK